MWRDKSGVKFGYALRWDGQAPPSRIPLKQPKEDPSSRGPLRAEVLACVYVEDGLGELLLVTCALTLFMIPSVWGAPALSARFLLWAGDLELFDFTRGFVD